MSGFIISAEKIHMCYLCDRTFSSNRKRLNRLQKIHEMSEPEDEFSKCPFKWLECSKVFKRLTALRQYLSQDHDIANDSVGHEFSSDDGK